MLQAAEPWIRYRGGVDAVTEAGARQLDGDELPSSEAALCVTSVIAVMGASSTGESRGRRRVS